MNEFVNFVKGFVGVVSRDAGQAPLRLPPGLSMPPEMRASGDHYSVLSFGAATPTLAPGTGAMGGAAWFKGRPFYETGHGSLAGLAGIDSAVVERTLRALDGKFSLFFAGADGSAVCATDMLSHGPLFYCERDGRLYFSTHMGVLLATLGTWNDEPLAVASLVISGSPVAGRTTAADVRRLAPCEYLSVRLPGDPAQPPGALRWSVRQYASLQSLLIDTKARPASLEERYDQLDELLRSSLAREGYTGTECLMLSGGRDSKAVALALHRDFELPALSATHGIPSSMDLAGARSLASRLGLPHQTIPYQGWHFRDYAPRIAQLNGGMSGLQTACLLPGFEFAGRSFGRVISGYIGDASIGARIPPESQLDFESVLRCVCFYLNGPDVWGQAYYPDEVALLIAELRTAFDQLSDVAPYQRWMLFKLAYYYAPLVSQAFDLCESYTEVSCPLYTRQLFRFALNLPEDLLRERRFYDGWLRRAHNLARHGQSLRGRAHSTLTALRKRLDDVRYHGQVRPDSISWEERMSASRTWLREQIETHCEDPRLRGLCIRSLDRSERWDDANAVLLPPTVLAAIAPTLARAHCV